MDEVHVPSMGLRYWVLFIAASVFGALLGDALPHLLPIGVSLRMAVQVALIAALFGIERRDRSSTEIYYWLAVILFQMTAVRLNEISTNNFGIAPFAAAGGLAILFLTTMIMARSDETHFYATMQLDRPGTEAKPLADVAHWLGLIVASTLGAVAADLCSTSLQIGLPLTAALLSGATAILLYRQSYPRLSRPRVFWLATILVRADGVAISDLMSKEPHLSLGLAASIVLTGGVMVGLLIFWRPPGAPRER